MGCNYRIKDSNFKLNKTRAILIPINKKKKIIKKKLNYKKERFSVKLTVTTDSCNNSNGFLNKSLTVFAIMFFFVFVNVKGFKVFDLRTQVMFGVGDGFYTVRLSVVFTVAKSYTATYLDFLETIPIRRRGLCF